MDKRLDYLRNSNFNDASDHWNTGELGSFKALGKLKVAIATGDSEFNTKVSYQSTVNKRATEKEFYITEELDQEITKVIKRYLGNVVSLMIL